jgi:hypothetical protein
MHRGRVVVVDSMEQFKQSVVDYVKLTDEVAASRKALADTRKRLKELQASIINHMKEHAIDQCNLKDGTLVLHNAKAPPPLSKELISEALQDEVGSERAQALAARVSQHRESNVQTKHKLKRTKARGQAT